LRGLGERRFANQLAWHVDRDGAGRLREFNRPRRWQRYFREFAAGRVWMPTKSALSGARHTDVTGFGASEDHGDGSALPRLVQSGNLSLEIWSDVG
jgi:hypothetical protein